jgi:hypothetical protein
MLNLLASINRANFNMIYATDTFINISALICISVSSQCSKPSDSMNTCVVNVTIWSQCKVGFKHMGSITILHDAQLEMFDSH